jgi:hypothetical protein
MVLGVWGGRTSLMAPNGPANGMTLAQVFTAVDVPKHTLVAWSAESRKRANGGLPRRRVARLRVIGPEAATLDVRPIAPQEFEEVTIGSRGPQSDDESLLRSAKKEEVKVFFESKDAAVSRINALYVLRRRMNAQVRMARHGSVLTLGPGEYLPAITKGWKTQ